MSDDKIDFIAKVDFETFMTLSLEGSRGCNTMKLNNSIDLMTSHSFGFSLAERAGAYRIARPTIANSLLDLRALSLGRFDFALIA